MAGRALDELKADLAAGSEAAYAALYDQYAARLYRAAYRLTGSLSDAEDVVQDTFVALVRHRANLPGVRDLEAYVFTICRHAAIRRAKKRPATQPLVQDIPAPSTATPNDELQRAVAQLPGAQREVIALKIDAGLTFAQIGQAMNVNLNTAASRYREGIRKLRDLMENER